MLPESVVFMETELRYPDFQNFRYSILRKISTLTPESVVSMYGFVGIATAGITPPEQRYSKLRNGGLIWTGILIYWKNCCQFVVHRIHCYRVLYFPILPLARINHRVCRQIIWRNRPGAAFCQRHIPIPYYAL